MPFYQRWLRDFAFKHSAIIVMPDLRLLAEATGLGVLEEVADFWTWATSGLPTVLAQLSPGYG